MIPLDGLHIDDELRVAGVGSECPQMEGCGEEVDSGGAGRRAARDGERGPTVREGGRGPDDTEGMGERVGQMGGESVAMGTYPGAQGIRITNAPTPGTREGILPTPWPRESILPTPRAKESILPNPVGREGILPNPGGSIWPRGLHRATQAHPCIQRDQRDAQSKAAAGANTMLDWTLQQQVQHRTWAEEAKEASGTRERRRVRTEGGTDGPLQGHLHASGVSGGQVGADGVCVRSRGATQCIDLALSLPNPITPYAPCTAHHCALHHSVQMLYISSL